MLLTGIALVVTALIGLWLCLPSAQSRKKWFLRGGADVLAAVAIVGCLGAGAVFLIAGFAQSNGAQTASVSSTSEKPN